MTARTAPLHSGFEQMASTGSRGSDLGRIRLSGTPQCAQYDENGSASGCSHFQHRSSIAAPQVGQSWGSSFDIAAAAWRVQSGLEQMAITAVGIIPPSSP